MIYQFVGSTLEPVMKHAVIGCPISSTCIPAGTNPAGISSGILAACVGVATSDSRSGRTCLMVATKLHTQPIRLFFTWSLGHVPLLLSVPPTGNNDEGDAFFPRQRLLDGVQALLPLERLIGKCCSRV